MLLVEVVIQVVMIAMNIVILAGLIGGHVAFVRLIPLVGVLVIVTIMAAKVFRVLLDVSIPSVMILL